MPNTVLFSQSFIKALLNPDTCPRYLHFKYILKVPDEPTELMFRGRYFEHHLLGATRDGVEPLFEPLSRGGESKAKKDLDALIGASAGALVRLGLFDPVTGKPKADSLIQYHLTAADEEGHIDLISHDFANPERRAIYDVKYTETGLDDRWNGWADFETRVGDKFQAIHYTNLYFEVYGRWVPFYFLVFGKAGWMRVIKVEVTELGMEIYRADVARGKEVFKTLRRNKWAAAPEYNKCLSCAYRQAHCVDWVDVPNVETFQI